MRRPRRRVWPVAALLLLGAAPAWVDVPRYHTHLEATYPAADTTHAGEVREVRLRFSEPVQVGLSSIGVAGPAGTLRVGPVAAVAGTEGTEIHVALEEPLASGAYSVEWRTAGPDGHVIAGSFAFSITALPEPTVAPEPAEATPLREGAGSEAAPTPEPDASGVASGWLFLATLAGMVGTVAFRLTVVGPFGRDEARAGAAAALRVGTRRLAWVALVGALAAALLRLVVQAQAVAGPGAGALSTVGGVLASAWGSAWTLGASGTLLFLVGLLIVGGRPDAHSPWLVCGLGALLAALTPGLSGHAASGGMGMVALDTVHVLAAGTWLGGLACLVLVGIPATNRAGEASSLGELVARFSRVALPAVVVVAVTGVANTLDRIALSDLFASAYGRALLVKLLAVAAAFALGFYNWRVVRPELAREGRPGLLRIPAALEMVAGFVVLALTAALVVTALP